MDKNKILVFGDDPTCHTGFARVTDNMVDAVKLAGFEPVVVGRKQQLANYSKCLCVNTNVYSKGKDPKGLSALEYVISAMRPVAVITVGDPWEVDMIPDLKTKYPFLWIYYVPIETSITARFVMAGLSPANKSVYLDVGSLLSKADQLVAYSQMGSRAIINMLETDYKITDPLFDMPYVPYVYHGVDTNEFKPASSSEKARAKAILFPNKNPNDLKLFTCIKTNSFRVGFDTLLEAWAQFTKGLSGADRSNVRLYLHTNTQGNGYQLPALIHRNNVADSVILDKNIQFGVGTTEEKLKLLYQATDISINAVRGEGFGLPQLEAMACGIPGIYPNCGTPPEFVGSSARLIPIAATYNPDFAPINFSIADTKKMATAMFDVCYQKKVYDQMSTEGVKLAKALTWAKFQQQFADIFKAIDTTHIKTLSQTVGYESI